MHTPPFSLSATRPAAIHDRAVNGPVFRLTPRSAHSAAHPAALSSADEPQVLVDTRPQAGTLTAATQGDVARAAALSLSGAEGTGASGARDASDAATGARLPPHAVVRVRLDPRSPDPLSERVKELLRLVHLSLQSEGPSASLQATALPAQALPAPDPASAAEAAGALASTSSATSTGADDEDAFRLLGAPLRAPGRHGTPPCPAPPSLSLSYSSSSFPVEPSADVTVRPSAHSGTHSAAHCRQSVDMYLWLSATSRVQGVLLARVSHFCAL